MMDTRNERFGGECLIDLKKRILNVEQGILNIEVLKNNEY